LLLVGPDGGRGLGAASFAGLDRRPRLLRGSDAGGAQVGSTWLKKPFMVCWIRRNMVLGMLLIHQVVFFVEGDAGVD